MEPATLARFFYFYEAMAIYKAYFSSLKEVSPAHRDLAPNLSQDRPLSWVPMVFHCTTSDAIPAILKKGYLKPSANGMVSFTETRFDELDRLRSRVKSANQVAIGFPRALLEKRGLFQPAYLRHAAPRIKAAFRKLAEQRPGYVELEDDLGAFQEVRVPGRVPISEAAWLLSSVQNESTEEIGDADFDLLAQALQAPTSYWNRTYQEEMLSEHVYYTTRRDAKGNLTYFEPAGEYYFLQRASRTHTCLTRFPAGRDFKITFPAISRPQDWSGPCTFFQVADFLFQEIQKLKKAGTPIDIIPRISFGRQTMRIQVTPRTFFPEG